MLDKIPKTVSSQENLYTTNFHTDQGKAQKEDHAPTPNTERLQGEKKDTFEAKFDDLDLGSPGPDPTMYSASSRPMTVSDFQVETLGLLCTITQPGLADELRWAKVQEAFADIDKQLHPVYSNNPSMKKGPVTPVPQVTRVVVDTHEAIAGSIDTIVDTLLRQSLPDPVVYVKCEGGDLGVNGTLDLLTMYIPSTTTGYIFDITTLGIEVLDTAGKDHRNQTMRNIFETDTIQKAFFDCRAKSEALSHRFGIRLAGVVDLQLLDLATQKKAGSRRKLPSLETSLERRLHLPPDDSQVWHKVKHEAKKVIQFGYDWKIKQNIEITKLTKAYELAEAEEDFDDSDDETYGSEEVKKAARLARLLEDVEIEGLSPAGNVWEVRPLREMMLKYCELDVVMLPTLYAHLADHDRYTEAWKERVAEETELCLLESWEQVPEVTNNLAPGGWDNKEWEYPSEL